MMNVEEYNENLKAQTRARIASKKEQPGGLKAYQEKKAAEEAARLAPYALEKDGREWRITKDGQPVENARSYSTKKAAIEQIEALKAQDEQKAKEEKNMETSFTHNSITVNGKTFPARYELQETEEMKRGQVCPIVHIWATVDGKDVKVDVPSDDRYYGDALRACRAAQQAAQEEEQPQAMEEAQEEEQPQAVEEAQEEEQPQAVEEAQEEEQPQAEEQPQEAPQAAQEAPARQAEEQAQERDPKQARGPIPEKSFVGSSIDGGRFKIIFDGETQRTRVIIPKEYQEKARPIVEKAGFYFSAAMESWNKKLTFRAYRAALALADELKIALAA